MIQDFERFYYPYTEDGDGVSNTRALDEAFDAQPIAKVWLFTIYLGLGVETTESILWLTETFFLNNPDIPL
jgi:hypothetical protein